MPSQWPCMVAMLILCAILLAVGGYFTIIYQKKTHLASCYLMGGSCREFWNCEQDFQSRERTTCINKRKVCCMPEVQVKSVDELDEESMLN
ncbi:hypothetical protein KR009_011988 [Drosophila setifemur]|nr:hypothetical protein KR009_011988 [Drosophila setifemur]